MRFIGWVIRVFQGWWNWAFKKPDEETIRRRKICATCIFRKKIGLGYICSRCSCPILQKTASPEETCWEKKW